MENPKTKRSMEDLSRHLARCNSCKETISFAYNQKSTNEFDIKKIYFQCHSYFCEDCARKKRGALLRKMKNLKAGKVLRFLTLTLSTKNHTPEQSIEKISNYVNTFVKLMRYRGFEFQYFKIIEFTKNNIAHVHMLVNCYMPHQCVRLVWQSITGAHKIWIERIKSSKMAINYIFKYMTKAVNSTANYMFYLYKKRRYSYSQNFFLPSFEDIRFILSRVYFQDVNEISKHVLKFFKNKFFNFSFINFNYLN